MPTAFDMIGHNAALQEHWIRRVIAGVIDSIIAVLGVIVLNAFLNILGTWPLILLPFLWGALFLVYGTIFEGLFGWTIGKKLLSLRVVAIDGMMDPFRALIRNFSKLHIVLLLIDMLIGGATHGDPRQRYIDRIARTSVTRVDHQAYMEEQFRMLQHVPPHPAAPPPGSYAPPPAPPAAQGQVPVPVPIAPGGWPQPSGGWPGQAPQQSTWPQHEWDPEGRLKPQMRYCTNCGGQLVARGDGKMTCVRCGAVY